jgi:thiol-disulfide isomerase/thioredoxin
MPKSFSKWLVLLCLPGIFFFPYCGKEKRESPLRLAPDFTLRTLDGKEITLSKLKGKVILLDFWATWCSPCRESIPHLIQLYKAYQKKGLEVIGINMDKRDMETVRQFAMSMNIPYPIVMTSGQEERDYGVTGLPSTILIDKKGRVRKKILGFTSEIAKQMTATVQDLLLENPQDNKNKAIRISGYQVVDIRISENQVQRPPLFCLPDIQIPWYPAF